MGYEYRRHRGNETNTQFWVHLPTRRIRDIEISDLCFKMLGLLAESFSPICLLEMIKKRKLGAAQPLPGLQLLPRDTQAPDARDIKVLDLGENISDELLAMLRLDVRRNVCYDPIGDPLW